LIFKHAGALVQRLRTAFPDREFIMRSHGQVRFIRISSRTQKLAAGGTAGVVALCCASVGALAVSHQAVDTQQTALADRAAAVASAETQVRKYRDDVAQLTSDLARRQQFIEQMVQAHIGDLPGAQSDGATAQSAPAPAQSQARKISAAMPEAGTLRKLQADQLAFVARLTRYADERSAAATSALRRLGLNPNTMIVGSREGMGGPLLKLATGRDGSLDPQFRRMGMSLARLDALENGLASLPQVSPAHVAYVSSSYGYRADPFTGGAAFHAGLDFPGPMGSPIYAAAQGTVSFVGQRQGYGNCIEVTHASGLMTRYGHLSGFRAHVGEKVEAGTVIGAMGSTGRSTGSHLHFEVRINDQPVNPRPFLEAARAATSKAQEPR